MNEPILKTLIVDKDGKFDPRLTIFTGPYPYFTKDITCYGCHNILKEIIEMAAKPNMVCLEVGSYVGESTSIFLPTIKKNNGVLYCVDIWEFYDPTTTLHTKEIFDFNMKVQGFEDNVISLKMTSEEANDCFRNFEFDFIYIDANHKYSAVKDDLNWFYPKVKNGGIFAGHDCEIKFTDCPHPELIMQYCDGNGEGWVPAPKNKPSWLPYEGFHSGVVRAVHELFEGKEYNVKDRVFYHVKRED